MLSAVVHVSVRLSEYPRTRTATDVTHVEQVDVDRLTGYAVGSMLKSGIENCGFVAPLTGVKTVMSSIEETVPQLVHAAGTRADEANRVSLVRI